MSKAELKEVPKAVHTVLDGDIGLAESKRQDWVVTVPPNVSVKEVEDSDFWAHVASKFQSLDKLEVRWEDHSQIANLRVLWMQHGVAKVKLINIEELDNSVIDADSLEGSKFEIKWKGPVLKWCIIRKSDSHKIEDGFTDKGVATARIQELES